MVNRLVSGCRVLGGRAPLVLILCEIRVSLSSVRSLEVPYCSMAMGILCSILVVTSRWNRDVFMFIGLKIIGRFSWMVAWFVPITVLVPWGPGAFRSR